MKRTIFPLPKNKILGFEETNLMKHSNQKAAFTLLEILVATAILAIVSTIALSLCSKTLDSWNRASEKLTIANKANFVLNLIEEDIETAFPNFQTLLSPANDISNTNTIAFSFQPSTASHSSITYRLVKDDFTYKLYRNNSSKLSLNPTTDLLCNDIINFNIRFRNKDSDGNLFWDYNVIANKTPVYAEINLTLISPQKAKIAKKQLLSQKTVIEKNGCHFSRNVVMMTSPCLAEQRL